MRVQVFGQFVVSDGHRKWDKFPTARGREILAFLALANGNALPRKWLIENVWPGLDPDSCRNRFNVNLSMLRGELGPTYFELVHGGRYSLRIAPNVENEWAEFWASYRVFVTTDSTNDKHAAAVELLEMKRGPLLVEIHHEWALTARSQTEAAFETVAAWLVGQGTDPMLVAKAKNELGNQKDGPGGGTRTPDT